MAGFTDQVARSLFYVVGSYHDGYFNRVRPPYPLDFNTAEQKATLDGAYTMGVGDRQQGQPDRYAGQKGLGDPGANVPVPTPPGAPPVYVPPGQVPPIIAGLSPEDAQRFYDNGYDDASRGVPRRADLGDTLTAPTGTPAYYYGLGYQDRMAGRPRQQLSLGYPGGTPMLNPAIGYELYPTVLGAGVPLNVALAAQDLFSPVVKWQLLGAYQGDGRRGFRLSGPGGLVMRTGQASGRSPADYGLTAYVGVHDARAGRSKVRLLDRRWLEDNIGPDWWALA